MFEVDPERHWIDPAEGSVTNLIQSLNTPLVAAGPHPAENVQSWIVSRKAGAAFDVFVYFHLTETNKAVVYRWDGGTVPAAQLEYVQEEAMSFCESMGFMMDDLGFGNLSPAKRGELVQTLPPFAADLSTVQKEVVVEENSKAVKLDPVEEFARARAAAAEAGQVATGDFAVPGGDDEIEDVVGFDPASAPPPQELGGEEMQIEITEVEGLDLIPEDQPLAPVVPGVAVEIDEPPLITGSIPVPTGRARKEPTPENQIDVFDLEALTGQTAPPMPQAPADDSNDISIDDVLADVAPANGNGSEDLGSALDDILDGVESSKPRGAPRPQEDSEPPLVVGSTAMAGGDVEVQIDMGGDEEGDPLAALESLGVGEEPSPAPAPAKPAGKKPVASPEISIDDLLGEPEPSSALDSAWASDGGTAERRAASNGKGSHGPLDIATPELARLLALL